MRGFVRGPQSVGLCVCKTGEVKPAVGTDVFADGLKPFETSQVTGCYSIKLNMGRTGANGYTKIGLRL